MGINEMQFDFMSGRKTANTIVVLRQLQENYFAKKKKLLFVFVDLEKGFDRELTNVA